MLRKRDLSDKLGESVESLFPKNPECILTPELTIGPYCMSWEKNSFFLFLLLAEEY